MTNMFMQQNNTGLSVDSSRAMAEVQAQIFLAKQFPRDEIAAKNKILSACRHRHLAEAAIYSYPKGGQRVEGPSIRLAESIAQFWGNIDYGVREAEQSNGHSQMVAYAHDLENNVRRTMHFTVQHRRHTKNGSKNLVDPRDIYENNANMGARRVRACLLGIIPGHIVDEAMEAVQKTLANSDGGGPIQDRVAKMVAEFQKYGVPPAAIEKRLGHPLASCNEADLVNLRKVFCSIRDGMGPATAFFDLNDRENKNMFNGGNQKQPTA